MAVIRILGIDPGTQVVGFGCLELQTDQVSAAVAHAAAPLALRASNVVRAGGGDRVRPLDCGVLRLGGRQHDVPERLWSLAQQFRALLERLAPHELALEEAFYGKSVQAALRIGEARGVVLAEASRAGMAIHQYAPARIKRCVTGRGDAGKEAVAEMVLRQLGAGGAGAAVGLPADASDALAAAMCRIEERRSPLVAVAEALARDGGAMPTAPGSAAGVAEATARPWRPRRRR
ncbi:MAG: crossover junction endodeoxyribonuclease RuvC [Planctomycetota bacterium]